MKYLTLIILFTGSLLVSELSSAEESKQDIAQLTNPFDIMPFSLPKSEPILYTNYRKKWSRLTGFEYSGLHWQQFVSIYVNKGEDIYRKNYLAYLALYRSDDDDVQEEDTTIDIFQEYELGTIFLKENYLSNEGKPSHPSSLTIMIKRKPGYDEMGGNWEYLQSDINGNVLMQGNSTNPKIKKVCSECHANMAERDYVFSTFLSAKPRY